MPNQNAFPIEAEGYKVEFGLTKREHFAVLILQAIISKEGIPPEGKLQFYASEMAIKMADNLLENLDQK